MSDSRPRTTRALPLPRRRRCTRARGAFHDKCGGRSHWADPQVLVDALTLMVTSSPHLSMWVVNVSTLVVPAYGYRARGTEVR
jgi:hypothetical protein